MVLPPYLFARLFSALMEELMVHCSYSDTPPPPPPISLAARHSLWPLLVWARPGPAWSSSVCSLCCVWHLYTCPPTCPQMPVCVADSLLEHSCLEDDVFYSCDCDFNVSICLVQTRAPTHPEQKHKGSLLVLHKIFLNFFFFFIINLILLFKLFISLCLFGWPFPCKTI